MRDPIWGAEFELKHVVPIQKEFNALQEFVYHRKWLILGGPKEKTMNLYEIFVVYAVVGANPIIRLPKEPFYYGQDEEEAKIHARALDLVDPNWNPAGVTVICHKLGTFGIMK